jgi:hypothetical protein
MSNSLRSRAAASTQDGWPEPAKPGEGVPPPAKEAPERPTIVAAPLDDVDYSGNAIADAEQVPVHVAWARVMADVQSISKADRRDDVGGRYNFRGVDRVVNAVGPALRRHGVLVLPTRIVSTEYGEARTSKGTVMQECKVVVEWTVRGPKGDDLPVLHSAGQATDTQDKATSKAISVAQRVLFLTSLQIPTQDPEVDRGHERGERPVPRASDYRDEIADPNTSLARLRQIRGELNRHGLAGTMVVNENGDDEQLLKMCVRVGTQRSEAGGAS